MYRISQGLEEQSMKKFKSIRLTILLILALLFSNAVSAATGSFVATGRNHKFNLPGS